MDTHKRVECGDTLRNKKRVITPARKEQNRIAQRLYRERQRLRRRCQPSVSLHRHSEPRPVLAPRPDHGHGNRDDEGTLRDENLRRHGHATSEVQFPASPANIGAISTHALVLEAVDAPNAPDEPFPIPTTWDTEPLPTTTQFTLDNVLSDPAVVDITPHVDGDVSLSWPNDSINICVPLDMYMSEPDSITGTAQNGSYGSPDNQSDEELWNGSVQPSLPTSELLDASDPAPVVHPLCTCTLGSTVAPAHSSCCPLSLSSPISNAFDSMTGNYAKDDDDHVSSMESTIAESQPNITAAQYGMQHQVSQAVQLADPWRNSIQFTTTTAFNAFLRIALSLRFNLEDITGANCLSSGLQSPFYRPATPRDNPQALLASARHPAFPANLQPTLSQILLPHHPFLDLIPFPALRDRAITLAVTMPHIFSMAELKKDIYIRGALVCWVRNGSDQPWDIRSWEAAPWFLRKWRLLVDSGDGALSKTSKWWQQARGVGVPNTVGQGMLN